MHNKKLIDLNTVKHNFFERPRAERLLRKRYLETHGAVLDTANPQTFSEKLYCRMIAVNKSGDPLMTRLSDKYLARTYAAQRIGEKHLVKLIWHGKSPDAIPFDELPPTCMIKVNHLSGWTMPVRNDLDKPVVVEKLRRLLRRNYYYSHQEYQYYGIEPRILVEEMLDDGADDGPLDYRFWCFDGQVATVQIDNHSHSINAFYAPDWTRLPGGTRPRARNAEFERPHNLEHLLALASSLSKGFDFVRVDLYNLKDRVIFGEMTFTPGNGSARFYTPTWEPWLGQCWSLANLPPRQLEAS